MKRKIYNDFLQWKRERRGEVALLVEGARRIGKSFIIEEFAKKEYSSYILVDFSVASPIVFSFFETYTDDLDVLLANWSYTTKSV